MGRRKQDNGPSGIAIVDKEPEWTSHDVVAKARGILGTRKVGHAGTLDPDATGVLVLGVGKATKLLRFLQLLPKTYVAEITFGTATSSLDASGEVTGTFDMDDLKPEAVAEATKQFVGEIHQIPPMVSAVKVDGRRLHELAREGKEVERKPRPVTVYRFDIEPTDNPLVYSAVIDCSSGTYVRTLADDLGRALGGGAHLSHLRRTAVGGFVDSESSNIESVKLLPIEEAMRGFPRFYVDAAQESAVMVGSVFEDSDVGVAGTGPWAVFNGEEKLLAVYERFKGSRIKPAHVLAS